MSDFGVFMLLWVVFAIPNYLIMKYDYINGGCSTWTNGDRAVTSVFSLALGPLATGIFAVIACAYVFRRGLIKVSESEYWSKPASW